MPTNTNTSTPLLALPSGSLLQFSLMTLPLLSVYLYFLYLTITRPSIAENHQNNPDQYLQDRIRLTDILHCYLVTLVIFSTLVVYLLWFVGKRRKLSKLYDTEGITILGNVEYDDDWSEYTFFQKVGKYIKNGMRRNDYGYVVYDLERVSSHPACGYYDNNNHGYNNNNNNNNNNNKKNKKKKPMQGLIRKKVRVYYHYPREQVSILVLPNYPYSGQPKIDLEADWASFTEKTGIPSESYEEDDRVTLPETLSRDKSLGVLIIATLWISFLFFSSLYVCMQMNVIEEYYQDESAGWAWTIFWVTVGGVVPIVAGLGNYLRWKRYEWWILRSGKLVSGGGGALGGFVAGEDEEGDYVQMT